MRYKLGQYRAILSLLLFFAMGTSAKAALEELKIVQDATTIQVPSLDVNFQIPQAWVDYQLKKDSQNIFVSPEELQKVRTSSGHWNRVYANITNALIPFENCFLQAGSNKWVSPTMGLHMRMYVTDTAPENLKTNILTEGQKLVEKYHNRFFKDRGYEPQSTYNQYNDWHMNKLVYGLWLNKFGGGAEIEFWYKQVKDKTLVLTFMYVPYPQNSFRSQINYILNSVKEL